MSRWGWEQMNIDYYEVTRATLTMVEVQRIQSRVRRQFEWLSAEVEPIPDSK